MIKIHLSLKRDSAVDNGHADLYVADENFTQAYPQIQLIAQDISTEQACHNLEHNETDLSFTTEHINTEQLMTMSMLSEPMVFVCPKTAP